MYKISKVFSEIDKDTEVCNNQNRYTKKVWVILITATISLYVIHYMKNLYAFEQTILFVQSLFNDNNLYRAIHSSKYFELYTYIWWGFWHYLFFLIIPMAIVKFVLKDSLKDYGFQIGNTIKHWKIYFITIIFFITFLSWFSFHNSSFAHYYPFYKYAYRSWFDLLSWEFIYILQFVALEFFFRGFLVQGLKIPFGINSVAIMIIPYTMIHLPKLWPEALGAIPFGLFLGILSLLSKSIWGGVAIHISVALTLDICALIQTFGLPN